MEKRRSGPLPPGVGASASWLREAHTGQGDRSAAGHSPKNLDLRQRWNYISVGRGWALSTWCCVSLERMKLNL